MNSSKTAITLNSEVLSEVDALVKKRVFPNRSRAIQEAVKEKLARLALPTCRAAARKRLFPLLRSK